MAKYIVLYTKGTCYHCQGINKHLFDTNEAGVKRSIFDTQREAELFVDKWIGEYPDITVIYGDLCRVVRASTKIILGEGNG